MRQLRTGRLLRRPHGIFLSRSSQGGFLIFPFFPLGELSLPKHGVASPRRLRTAVLLTSD